MHYKTGSKFLEVSKFAKSVSQPQMVVCLLGRPAAVSRSDHRNLQEWEDQDSDEENPLEGTREAQLRQSGLHFASVRNIHDPLKKLGLGSNPAIRKWDLGGLLEAQGSGGLVCTENCQARERPCLKQQDWHLKWPLMSVWAPYKHPSPNMNPPHTFQANP